MMTDKHFNDRLAEIDQRYARGRTEVEARRDQELCRLFEECGWTQERIGRRMGKSQNWVSYRLTFGRFLNFITSGDKNPPALAALTERAFRRLYARTRGGEPERFAEVVEKL